MSMKTNFDKVKTSHSGQRIDTGGPLRWAEMPGINKVRVCIAVKQNGAYALGESDREFTHADGRWWCNDVDAASGEFEQNEPCAAGGMLMITDPAGEEPWLWVDEPTVT
jgi:hypothetical protein